MKVVKWVLRIGIFGTFLGHGIIALSVTPSWLPYLTVVGFSEFTAQYLMRSIGCLDLIVAAFVLIKPMRIVLIWACIWTFATALVRPIAGESILEFVERGANWAAPLALLLLKGLPKKRSDWLK